MEIGLVGLGKMGGNMLRRLRGGGHRVVALDLDRAAVEAARGHGAEIADSLEGVVAMLDAPRVVWAMVPAGAPIEATLSSLGDLLAAGDVVVDGGNSNFRETMRRGAELARAGVRLVDVGTSGGVWGLAEGYSMMVGGDAEAVALVRPALETLAPAPDRGWGHVGPSGAGHFVKMVHNGIEYGLMQAYAEGFELLAAGEEFGIDLHQVSQIWRHGSVVRSWLLDLAARVLEENPTLEGIAPYVADSGEGRWTVVESVERAVPTPVITAALQQRFRSRQDNPVGPRLLAALRNQFGGHVVKVVE